MTSDIHPHWKSVGAGNGAPPSPESPKANGNGDSFWPMPEESPEHLKPPQIHRVRVARSGVSLFLVFTFVPVGIMALGFVFLRGVNLIRADLTDGLTPGIVIDLTDAGFSPADAEVKVGEIVEWKNVGSAPRQFRSRELNTDGSPLLASSLLQPGETFRLKVPPFLEEKSLTLSDAFIPTMEGTLTITKATTPLAQPQVQLATPQELSSTPPAPSLVPPPPQPVPMPAPGQPAPVPSPLSVAQSPSPILGAPIPTLSLGMVEMATPSPVALWPALLRINPYTFDRVSSLSPVSQLPIHAVARAREKVRSSKTKPPLARKQPETGPALWIVAALSLCGAPLFWRKSGRSKQRVGW